LETLLVESSNNQWRLPQSRCRVGIAKADITPPVGIYHRMWGAALQDRSTGVHRPLEAALLWLAPREGVVGQDWLLVSLDYCILDRCDLTAMAAAIASSSGVSTDRIIITLTHTHGSGRMSRERGGEPGGELIGPYLDRLCEQLAELAVAARDSLRPSTLVYDSGHCDLARHRDFYDAERGGYVCGFNPRGMADDTLMVVRVTAEGQSDPMAVIVNYACHPTTLAWDNSAISPDWVGAMRSTLQAQFGGGCFFLQGASGDLGPREGFVGDTAVADRNGRQVAWSALAVLEGMPPADCQYVYRGPVISGAVLGTWDYQPLPAEVLAAQTCWRWETLVVELPYRHDLPDLEQTRAERQRWLGLAQQAEREGDRLRQRDCRAQSEQMTRQIGRLESLPPGKVYPLCVRLALLGEAMWVLVPGELYQIFQRRLRERLGPRPVIVGTLAGDWNPGYIPTAEVFGLGIYQELIAATSPGSLELLIERVARAAEQLDGEV
jgi:hypothetical protein